MTTPSSAFSAPYLNVTVATSDIGSLTLDGAPVPAGDFSAIGGDAEMSGAQLSIGRHPHAG